VRLAFSSFSATNSGFFTAIDEKLFERRGIDLAHVYIASSSVVLPAVLTREVDLATLSGETVVRAYHQGAKNLTIIGTQLDKFTFSLYTKPEIKIPQDLRGKILGVSRFGGSLCAEKYLNKSMTTEPRMLSIVFDRIGVTSLDDREKLFKGLVDNSVLAEAKALRAATVR
jgi:ABC-type nitrate/sulfonate/bicarbonate transport system substrate-binding protein